MTEPPADPVQALFDRAVVLPPAERAAFLDAACQGNPGLRAEVESLLAQDDRLAAAGGDGPLQSPLVRAPEGLPPERSEAATLHFDAPGPPPDGVPFEDRLTLPPTTDGPAAVAVPGYEVLRLLGQGGMGRVYLARQPRLNRLVALKVLLAGGLADDEELGRFLTEARTVARFQHPNIVQVYEVGECDQGPFIALEYVPGGSLADRLAGKPWPARAAAELLRTLALAVHHAHQGGVVHRDLKPANILGGWVVGSLGDGQNDPPGGPTPSPKDPTTQPPKIADFGLAKHLGAGPGLTQSQAVMGTPGYMAPEQAEGQTRHVGPAADIYALGAILYELLTGRPPFIGASPLEVLYLVINQDPVPVQRVERAVPADLATICMKCLEKEPGRRYASAQALADDLGRFLAGEPIRARPVTELERLWKWAKRRPGLAGALALAAAALVGGTVVSLHFAFAAWHQADQSRAAASAAQAAEAEARAARKASDFRLARLKFAEGLSRAETGAVDQGLFAMVEALRLAPDEAAAAPFRRAVCANVAAWRRQLPTLRYAQTFAPSTRPSGGVWFRAAGSSGEQLLLFDMGRPASAAHLDAATGRPVPGWRPADYPLTVSRDGRSVLILGRDQDRRALLLYDLATGRPCRGPVPHALTPGGANVPVEPACLVAGTDLALTTFGERLAANPPGGRRLVWDLARGGRLAPDLPAEAAEAVVNLVHDRTGRPLLVHFRYRPEQLEGQAPRAEFWDLATGRPLDLGALPGPLVLRAEADPTVYRDGRTLIAVDGAEPAWFRAPNDGTVSWWDVATGRQLEVWQPRRPARVALLTGDGRGLALQGRDDRARLLDLDTGWQRGGDVAAPDLGWEQERRWPGVAVAGAGALLVTWHRDGVLRAWDCRDPWPQAAAAANPRQRPPQADPARVTFQAAALSPDGRRAALRANALQGAVRLVDVATGLPAGAPLRQTHAQHLAWSPDSRLLATARFNNRYGGPPEVCWWDAATGRPHRPPTYLRTYVHHLAFSPDGRTLAAAGVSQVTLIDVATTKTRVLPEGPTSTRLAFSPDGALLAVGCIKGWGGPGDADGFHVWDVAAGKPAGPFQATGGPCQLWWGDGGRLLLALDGATQELTRRDPRTGQALPGPLPRDRVALVATRPQDAVVALVTSGGTVEQWDLATGRPVGEPWPQPFPVEHLAYSPDGRVLAIGGADRAVRLADSATGLPLGLPLLVSGPLLAVQFTPDAGAVITATGTGDVRSWPLAPPVPDDHERLDLWLQAAAGRAAAGRETALLSPDVWQQRCRELEARWPEAAAALAAARAGGGDDWHRRCAREAEATNNTFAALWHLERLDGAAAVAAQRGSALAAVGDLAAAEDAFRQVPPAAGPWLADWYRHQAETARIAGPPGRHQWYLDRLLALAPDDWRALADRADLHGRQGRPAEQEADATRAVAAGAPAEVVAGLAEAQARRGRGDLAARWLAAAERSPTDPDRDYHLGLARIQARDAAGFRRGVTEGLQQTLRQRPVEAQRLHALLHLTTLSPDGMGDWRPVVAYLEQLLSLLPAAGAQESAARREVRAAWLATYGAALVRAGRPKDAVAQLQAAVAADDQGGQPYALLFLALAQHRQGQPDEARRWLAKAAALPPAPEGWGQVEVAILLAEVRAAVGQP